MASGTETLDDFLALNDQLAALVRAGVPIDLGLGDNPDVVAGSLERINATVARRVRRGESLSEALDDDTSLPESYRCMMQLGIRSGDFSAPFDGPNRLASVVDDSRHAVGSAFVYPLVVCGLAYAGLIGFCLFFVPSLEQMYDSLRVSLRPAIRVLHSLRVTLPYWVAVPPLATLLLVAWRRKAGSLSAVHLATTSRAWLPGASRIAFQQRAANFATALSELISDGVPLAEALPLAAGAAGDTGIQAGAQALSQSLAAGSHPADNSPTALRFPPFLRWALWHAEETTGQARALDMAAKVYRDAAEQSLERLRFITPIATLVLLGGSATLLYGLALFAPFVELLRTLAS
jgi:general secretion pathway protein F